MTTNHLAPVIRFKGFTDAWEQSKLGEVSDVTKLAGFEFTKYVTYQETGKIIALRGLNVKNGHLILNDIKYIDKSDFSKLNRSKLYKNDILFTYVGTVGELAIVPEDDRYYLAPNVARIRLISDTNPIFVSQMMNSTTFYKRIILPLIATSSQPALSMESVRKFELMLPTATEQTKIGNFFKQLDDTIALHQRELDLLKEQKKGFLQKMFPKKDEVVPEIRFKGFTDAWEQRKAKDIFKPLVEKNRKELPVLSVTQDMGVVYREDVGIDIKYDLNTLNNYKVVKPNDFIISLRSFQGGFELSDKLGIVSPAYTIFNALEERNNYSLFWKVFFKRFIFIESLKTVTFGIRDGKSISFTEFGDLKLAFANLEEQTKIGNFFKQLDDTIALHQCELEKLQEMKKAFLQKMFV